MKRCLYVSFFLILPLALAVAGEIKGVVVDESGSPVAHIVVEAFPLDMGISGGWPRALTDQSGHFDLTVVSGRDPDSGRLYGQRWAVYPHSEKNDYYPDLSSRFYRTATNHAEHVGLSEERPEAEVRIQLGPKAGSITGHVTDLRTGRTLMPEFDLSWSSEPSNRMGVRMRDPYRILLPPNTPINVIVQCEGYKPWAHPGPISVDSGGDIKLDIKLEPLPSAREP